MSKLKEVLDNLDPREVVFVGSQSGWFDIAYAGEMRRDGYLTNLSEKLYKRCVALRDVSERRFNEQLKAQVNWKEGSTLEQKHEAWKEYAARVKKAYSFAVKSRDNVDGFVPLREREVKEIYERIQGDGTCIVVDGAEVGRYWVISEKYPGGMPQYSGELVP